MNILFIITTKYHLGCALDIFTRFYQTDQCDIAIIGSGLQKDSKLIADAAKYMQGEIVLLTEESGKLNKMRDMALLLYRSCITPKKAKKYDRMIVFSPSLISARYRLENPQAEVCLGEDGTGSYSGLILKRFAYFDASLKSDRKPAKLMRGIFKSKLDLNPCEIYVYQPEAVTYHYPFPVKKISRTVKTNEIIRNAMGSHDDNVPCCRAVFLGQCYDELDLNSTDMIEITEASNIFGNEFSYRKHPRDNWVSRNIKLDLAKDWELLCENVSEDSVFISLGSTALQSPKYLYDKEPYLVFTYKLHPKMSKGFSQSFELLSKSLKKLYHHSDKIYVAENIDDYIAILESIKRKTDMEK